MAITEKVFGELRNPLLARLSGSENLLFAGQRDYINYLIEFYGKSSSHAFVASDATTDVWQQKVVDRQTIIVVSDDEEAIATRIESMFAGLERRPRVVRLFGDLFINAICSGDPWKWGPQQLTSPKASYAIISTPRTGTEFLCEALASTRLAGFPKEHLRSQSEVLTKYCNFDADRYLRILMTRTMTSNQVFGTKLISHFLLEHIQMCPHLEVTIAQFKYIRVSRRDLVGQAISAMLAARTGMYHIRNDEENDRYRKRLLESQIGPADLREVDQLRKKFSIQRRQMDEFLVRHSITPLDIAFEDLIENPVQSVNAVLAYLEIPIRIDKIAVAVRKTRDANTETVRSMYLRGAHG